jgi:hypothetical protein
MSLTVMRTAAASAASLLVAAAVLGIGASPAFAQDAGHAASAPGGTRVTAGPAVQDYVTPAPGVDAVRVHEAPDSESTTDGLLYPGHTLACYDGKCVADDGQFNACPGTGNSDSLWIRVRFDGRSAPDYVADSCVTATSTPRD